MKICLIEADPLLLENVRLWLAGEPGFRVTGAYASGEAALREMPWQGAEVLLVDVDEPGRCGLELIGQVHPKLPELQILAYTISDNRAAVLGALQAGASGYVLKGCLPRELIESLRHLAQGGAPMSPQMARKVIRELEAPPRRPQPEGLSPREKQLLSGIALGKSYEEMGQALSLSPHTLQAHLQKVYQKLQAAPLVARP